MPTTSPSMGLVVPVIGVDSGLVWEQSLVADLSILDGHTHSPGSGVQINPAGININSALNFQGQSATGLQAATFTQQASFATLNSIFFGTDGNLYINDGAGDPSIQVTSGGAVLATSSGIASGTASASFSSGVLVVNSAASTPANIQVASVLLGNNSAGSKFLTLSPPAAMAANYSLTLPTIPGSTGFVTLDTSGNFSASSIPIANGITRSNQAAVGQQISASCGNYVLNTSGSQVAVTNLTVTITTSGRPVIISLIDDGTSNSSVLEFSVSSSTVLNGSTAINIARTGTSSNNTLVFTTPSINCTVPNTGGGGGFYAMPLQLWTIDPVGAGTYTYTVYSSGSTGNAQLSYFKLMAYEL